MSELSLLADLEKKLVQVDVPPQPKVLLKAGEAGKDEPEAVVYVNAVTPKEFSELDDNVASILQNGFRQNSRQRDAKEEEIENQRLFRWAKKLIHHSEGFTVGNLNRLLVRAQKEFDLEQSPDLVERFDKEIDGRSECDLGQHPVVAVLILKLCRGIDFHAPIQETAREGAVMHAEELKGKASA